MVLSLTAEALAQRIVAQTADFVLLDKPAGLSFHQHEAAPALFPLLRQVLGEDAPLFAVHRLDTLTSGLLLIARHAAAARELGQQFAEHRIEKRYLALSDRQPKKKQGKVVGDMAAARNGSWKLTLSRQHPAITEFVSAGDGLGGRFFLLRPHSGRTHQIRVALKSLGAPILGDLRYHPHSPATDRGYLHAVALAFRCSGQTYCYTCPPNFGQRFLTAAAEQAYLRFGSEFSGPWPLTQCAESLGVQPEVKSADAEGVLV